MSGTFDYDGPEVGMSIDRVGVHRTHCCTQHGCKYGNVECPVVQGLVKQEFPCESCREERAERVACQYLSTTDVANILARSIRLDILVAMRDHWTEEEYKIAVGSAIDRVLEQIV